MPPWNIFCPEVFILYELIVWRQNMFKVNITPLIYIVEEWSYIKNLAVFSRQYACLKYVWKFEGNSLAYFVAISPSQPEFTSSMSTIETPEKWVKSVQS